ncbi:hypothetical protein E1B28_001637 [Marasmius oreades]|uniref:Uncharacterized protein n=1 Tax=Marasmius oreades TaxID=181124 RepID=A0A9P7V400_9AGAR|nr:uncharacterized protein E1B28_001637 [Marasmius oreades]KAG7099829.1 hypothetical protein E1B28_001637 [Marasmius oreades]
MLVLSTLHTLLSQVITPSTGLHTAILSTPAGQLVCYASDAGRPKDEIRVIVGLSGEVWQETLSLGSEDIRSKTGMVSSELGRILVLPVDVDEPRAPKPSPQPLTPTAQTPTPTTSIPTATRNGSSDSKIQTQEYTPLMLLTLSSTEEVEWEELQMKGKALASHIAKPLSKYREHLQQLSTPTTMAKTPPANSSASGNNSVAVR